MKRPTKPAKKRGQADTKGKLLKAALDIFSREGYDAATTRHIAKKAGVNESLIHRYFESKLGLFLQLKDQFRQKSVSEYLSHEESSSLEEELLKFLGMKLNQTGREKKFFKLVISRAILDPKVRDDVRRLSGQAAASAPLLERFEQLREKGLLRKDIDTAQILSLVQTLAFSVGFLVDALECVGPEDAQKLVDTICRVVSDGLRPQGSKSK
jgi:AcrR family transcriptional regulator